jgi:ankyrin repeat protein
MNEMSDKLVNAAGRGDLQEVKELVANGADIRFGNDFVLRRSAEKGRLGVIKYLISKGANIHVWNDYPLRMSAFFRHFDVVDYLVENGANVDISWISNNCNGEMANHIKLLKNSSSSDAKDIVVDDNEWNTTCKKCGSKAYQGFSSFECSGGCG